MKKIATIAILVAAALAAVAQGEWKWAHCIGGGNGGGTAAGDFYNRISTAAFDDDGNLYVYGSIGGSARIDNELLPFSEDSRVLLSNIPGIMLAKFDTLGNMLWCKVVKQSSYQAWPNWMEVRDGKVYIIGNGGFGGDSHHEWLYYLDTLIEESQINALPDSLRKPPFKKYTLWSFFAIFDLDGNLLEDCFIESYSREYIEPWHFRDNRAFCSNTASSPAPFHVDRAGNWYLFNPIGYRGVDTLPYTIVVYGDTTIVYDLYLPGSIDPSEPYGAGYSNSMLYKFSPDWRLLSTKLLVDHVEGMNPTWPNGGDSISSVSCYYQGLSFDEDDNMYLSGYMQMRDCRPYSGGLLHHYPVYYYWDSVHRLVVHDITSAEYANFVIKYDTAGNVVWCNQLHTKGYVVNNNNVRSAYGYWDGNTLSDNSVYVMGYGYYYIDDSTKIYFDNESNPLQRFTEYTYTELHTEMTYTTEIAFFARYDKNTGTYISHGIAPAIKGLSTRNVGVVNNRVFGFTKYDYATYAKNLWVEWDNNGLVIQTDSVEGMIQPRFSLGVVANERGYVTTVLSNESPMEFSSNVVASCGTNDAKSVIAMYYDPAFANEVPDREDCALSVKVWTNPAVQSLQVESDETLLESVSVLDLSGRELHRQTVYDHRCRIDVSRLPVGMYLLKITGDGNTWYEKFLKSGY